MPSSRDSEPSAMRTFPVKKWITMPVEVAARELDAKLLLGCAAVDAGYNVIVGSIRAVDGSMDALPRGLWITGNIDRTKADDMKRLRRRGYRIVCMDEEAFMQFSDSHYARNRLSVEGIDQIDYMLAAGSDHERMVTTAFPHAKAKVVQTGNPRVDLLRREFRDSFRSLAAERQRRFGRFVLINTNFSENSFVSQAALRHMRVSTGGIADDRDVEWYAARHQYETAMLDEFIRMVHHLGRALPDMSIVLRPHPSENIERWRAEVRTLPNVIVCYEGSVHSWAMAAGAVVHNSCTTGVESHLLGRPVFAFRPIRSDEYDLWLANAVSEEVTSADALVSRLQGILDEPQLDPPYRSREALERAFGPLDGRLAYERALDVMNTIHVESTAFPQVGFPSPFLVETLRELARLAGRRLPFVTKKLFGDDYLTYWGFDYQKFPTVRKADIEARVQELYRSRPCFSLPTVTQLSRNLFALTAASETSS